MFRPVVTLRCTQKLLSRLCVDPAPAPSGSTTLLGEWYATLIVTRPAHLVLCASERSLLPVVVAAAPSSGFGSRFRASVAEVLGALGIAPRAIALEACEMADLHFDTTANRRVLGSLSDFRLMLPSYLKGGASMLEASLHLAEAPCGRSGWRALGS